jgi:uncharacterized protein
MEAGMIDFKFTKAEFKASGDDGFIAGYANVYGVKDLGGDIVEPGAFADSIKGKTFPMLWGHDSNEPPIGLWNVAKEDKKGLYVEGKFTLAIQRAKDIYESIKANTITGLSIGFKTIEREIKDDTRHILKGELWEVSVVNFPMNPLSKIDMVKARSLTKEDLEREITKPGAGLSRSVAIALLRGGYAALNAKRDAGDSAESRMLDRILKEIRSIKGITK